MFLFFFFLIFTIVHMLQSVTTSITTSYCLYLSLNALFIHSIYTFIHLHRIGIRPDPNCMLCSFRESMDINHLGSCTALFNRTGCERYWEARTEMMEN